MADENKWHLDKRVPLSIIIALVMQTLVLIVWAVKLDARVEILEHGQIQQDTRLSILETTVSQVAVIKDRQDRVIATLEANAKKLDDLLYSTRNGK